MSNSLPSPELWKSLPFADKNAFVDFLGSHSLWHTALDKVIRAKGAASFPVFNIGDGPVGEDPDWILVHENLHAAEAAGLGLSGPPDLSSYDLNHRDEFATFTWVHANECIRLQTAAGL